MKVNYFEWVTEGLLTCIIGIIGLFGNGVSIWTFWRQRVHRIFHNLLLVLAIFDMVYVVCSIHLFSLAKFWPSYEQLACTPSLPYVIPIAQISLMGSVYCTVALAVERFLAVCYPFLPRKRVYSTKTFVIPVICFTILYNVSKFFELEVVVEHSLTLENGTMLYGPALENFTSVSQNDTDLLMESFNATYVLQPTKLRLNSYYFTIYILWMNLIFNILGPFVALAVLNHMVYRNIKDFESRVNNGGLGVCLTSTNSRRNGNASDGSQSRQASQRNHRSHRHLAPNVHRNGSLNNHQLLDTASSQPGDRSSRNLRLSQRSRISNDPDEIMRIEDSERIQLNDTARSRFSRASARSNRIRQHATPRRREVLLSKISIYIVYMFVCCHSVRIIPTIYELIWHYAKKTDDAMDLPWPEWVAGITNVSHFLLTLVCSSNFFIYYLKHGTLCRSRSHRARMHSELGSPATQPRTTNLLGPPSSALPNSATTTGLRHNIIRLSSRTQTMSTTTTNGDYSDHHTAL